VWAALQARALAELVQERYQKVPAAEAYQVGRRPVPSGAGRRPGASSAQLA
jgi:hypothetical protein